MRKRIIYVLTALVLLNPRFMKAQQPSYLTYKYAAALFNPAYTGLQESKQASLVFGREMIGTKNDPMNYHLNYIQKLQNQFSIGFSASNSVFNVQNTLNVAVDAAYQLQLNREHQVYFGIKVGIENFNNRLSSLSISDKDPSFGGKDLNVTSPMLGAGLLVKGRRYFVGIGVPNLVTKNEYKDIDSAKKPITNKGIESHLTAGYSLDLNKKLQIIPMLYMGYFSKSSKKVIAEFSTTAYYNRQLEVTLGGSSLKKIFVAVGFQLNKWGKIAYAYDYFLSDFSSVSQGIHGFLLQAQF